MNREQAQQLRHRALLTLSLWGAVAVALLQLPADAFPLLWLAAFTLPAVLFLLLQRVPFLPMPARLGLATVFQVSAAYLALHLAGELDHAPALACTLLPPLAYVTLRRQDTDVVLALFLAFCLQLVGTMLGRGGPGPLTVLFTIAAVLTLRFETRTQLLLQRHRFVASRRPARKVVLGTLGMAISSAALGLLAFFTLAVLPVPGAGHRGIERPSTRNPFDSPPVTGLSPRFELSNTAGRGLGLDRRRLARIQVMEQHTAPTNLYLRAAHFDVPGIDQWTTYKIPTRQGTQWRIPRAVTGRDSRWIEVERLSWQDGIVYAPAGTDLLISPEPIQGSTSLEWFLQETGSETARFEAHYYDLHAGQGCPDVAPGWDRLTGLPAEMRTEQFTSLAAEFFARTDDELDEILQALVDGLWDRCRYELKTPTGPFDHALLNFLHGGRHGYCMHFASAGAALLRLQGIPCRIAVGLYGGDPDPNNEDARVFGSHHAHAWVEIPLQRWGWTVFDPTPPSSRAVGNLPPGDQQLRNALGAAAGPDERPETGGFSILGLDWKLVLPWLLLGLLCGAWFLRPTQVPPKRLALPILARPARAMLVRLLAELTVKGYGRGSRETLERYGARLRVAGVDDDCELWTGLAAYQEVRFGGRILDEHRSRRLEDGLSWAKGLRKREGS